jgi:iron complex transport system ATP-binding protein
MGEVMEVEVRNGHFGYSRQEEILTDISFRLPPAQILTILGRNGIGKTTLLKCLLGILPWKSGITMIDGERMNYKKHMVRIGYAPQAYKFVFPYSVEETVMMGLAGKVGLFSIPTGKDKERVHKILDEVGIFHLKKRLCSQLSGGQLQLVFMARGLVKEPELMILDEPESHLDYKNQILILRMLEKMAREHGISCIINTHYPDHALRISDVTLIQGRKESGEKTYIYGPTDDIVTEENIKSFFGVESRIITIESNDKKNFRALVVTE